MIFSTGYGKLTEFRLAVLLMNTTMTVKMKAVKPMLTVASLEATITFYRDILGFQCVSRVDYWAALRNGEAEVMIALPNAHVPFEKPAFTGALYFNPDDVDALWESLRDRVTIVYPIENFFYGMREFAILDNNGYMLQFGQEIEDPSLIPPPE